MDVRVVVADPPRSGLTGPRSTSSGRTSSTESTSSLSLCRRCVSEEKIFRSLVEHFAAQVTALNGWKPIPFTAEAIEALQTHAWPGNVRELRNMVERLMLLAPDGEVDLATVRLALPQSSSALAPRILNSGALAERVQSFEREVILAELKQNQYNVSKRSEGVASGAQPSV